MLLRVQPCSPKEPSVVGQGHGGGHSHTEAGAEPGTRVPYLLTLYCSEQPAPPAQGFSFSSMGSGTRSRG